MILSCAILVGHTTLFVVFECPPLAEGEPPVTVFQSALNPFNFLGVRRNPNGVLELVSDVSHVKFITADILYIFFVD